jgi:hypothetical protein
LNWFEQVNEGIIIGADALDFLKYIHITGKYTWKIEKCSYSEKDGKAGEYGLCRREWLQNQPSERCV